MCVCVCVPTLKIVEVWVLGHPTVDEGPGEVVHSILLVLNRLCHHLRIEVVVQKVIQMRLCVCVCACACVCVHVCVCV